MLPPVYYINMERSKDRKRSMEVQLRKRDLDYQRISAIDGNRLTEEDISNNSTPFARYFCTSGIIGCFMSHQKAWRQFVHGCKVNECKASSSHIIIMEDDVTLEPDFCDKLNSVDRRGIDFLYIGAFGPKNYNKRSEWTWIQYLQSLFLKRISKYSGDKSTDDRLYVPDSPVGFHCYMISRRCAETLLRIMDKVSYHVDFEFVNKICEYQSQTNDKLGIYALRTPLATQSSTSKNSTLANTNRSFPVLLNGFADNFIDSDNISMSYYLTLPIMKLGETIVNLYVIFGVVLSLVFPGTVIGLLLFELICSFV